MVVASETAKRDLIGCRYAADELPGRSCEITVSGGLPYARLACDRHPITLEAGESSRCSWEILFVLSRRHAGTLTTDL